MTAKSAVAEKNDVLLSISTAIEKPETVDLDGEIYDVYSAGHIGEDKETELLAQFQMLNHYGQKLDGSTNLQDARKWSKKVRDTQIEIINTLTNIPAHLTNQLPAEGRASLMEILSKEAGKDDTGDAGDAPNPL